jgi:pimeloyl-ACP methyl ester carboxylesterase
MSEDHQSPRSRRPRPAHSPRLRVLTTAAALAAVASVPISGTGIATPAEAAPALSTAVSYDTTGPPPGGVPGVPVPTIRWSDAGEGYQQAYAAVPYDYARPAGKTFRLKLVRLPATDRAHRIGSLFINFGGPGDTAAVKVRQIGRFLLPPPVLARYDLVGVDPRGTGESQPVRCTASTSEQLTFPYATAAKFPVTRAEQAEAIRQVPPLRGAMPGPQR